MKNEYLDVYDGERNFTGKIVKRGTQLLENEFRLVVHIVIFNKDGKMLIQQRQATKDRWPNLWDISVGGNVKSGETTKMAGIRETKEELGLDIEINDIRPAFTIGFEDGFDDFYFIERDLELDEIVMQEDEVQNVKWATKEDVIEMCDDGVFIPFYKTFLELLFDMKLKRGIHTT